MKIWTMLDLSYGMEIVWTSLPQFHYSITIFHQQNRLKMFSLFNIEIYQHQKDAECGHKNSEECGKNTKNNKKKINFNRKKVRSKCIVHKVHKCVLSVLFLIHIDMLQYLTKKFGVYSFVKTCGLSISPFIIWSPLPFSLASRLSISSKSALDICATRPAPYASPNTLIAVLNLSL